MKTRNITYRNHGHFNMREPISILTLGPNCTLVFHNGVASTSDRAVVDLVRASYSGILRIIDDPVVDDVVEKAPEPVVETAPEPEEKEDEEEEKEEDDDEEDEEEVDYKPLPIRRFPPTLVKRVAPIKIKVPADKVKSTKKKGKKGKK